MKKSLFFAAGAIAVSLMASACSGRGGVTFVANNVGKDPVKSLVVHITGKSYALGDVEPGHSASVVLDPASESHIELEFADHRRQTIDCYFERGYSGSVTVDMTPARIIAVRNAIRL